MSRPYSQGVALGFIPSPLRGWVFSPPAVLGFFQALVGFLFHRMCLKCQVCTQRMTESLIELRNVSVVLNGNAVLHDISWRLAPGEHWAVSGGNGSGKSTFLKLIRGEVWPAPGKGERISRIGGVEQETALALKQRVAMVSPELQDRYLQQEWRLTALQVVSSGFLDGDYVYERPSAEEKRFAGTIVQVLAIEPLLKRNVQQLSTGELRKVLIARALAGRPSILALDEVCDGLDAPARQDLLGRLAEIARSGTQLLFATHRNEEVFSEITHELVLEKGRIIWSGRRAECSSGKTAREPSPKRRAIARWTLPSPSPCPLPRGEGNTSARSGEGRDAWPKISAIARRTLPSPSPCPLPRGEGNTSARSGEGRDAWPKIRPIARRTLPSPSPCPLPWGEGDTSARSGTMESRVSGFKGQSSAALASSIRRVESGRGLPHSKSWRTTRTLVRIEGADVFLEGKKVLTNIDWEGDQERSALGGSGPKWGRQIDTIETGGWGSLCRVGRQSEPFRVHKHHLAGQNEDWVRRPGPSSELPSGRNWGRNRGVWVPWHYRCARPAESWSSPNGSGALKAFRRNGAWNKECYANVLW